MTPTQGTGAPTPDSALAAGRPPQGDARPLPDFSNTEETFRHLSNGELAQAARLFKLMGSPFMTRVLTGLGAQAVRFRLPGAAWSVRKTVYKQFVGGVSLEDAQGTIRRLAERSVTSILDYGSEAGSTAEAFDRCVAESLRAIRFAAENDAADAIVLKMTGIAPDEVLERLNDSPIDFDGDLDPELGPVLGRLDKICGDAAKAGIQVYLDAEESWLQNTIDALADEMMRRYNRERVLILNTFQLYRHDRLAFLRQSYERAEAGGYRLGAKLVRGAYMVKERARAEERGYASPIQPDIGSTHRDYDAAVEFCLERVERLACTVASHNANSTELAARYLDEHGIPRDHPHVRFSQLLGMSDNLTFNLAAGGYNASKYQVYGPVSEVLPYLVRRAQENTSVTGEMGRELALIESERRRRRAARG